MKKTNNLSSTILWQGFWYKWKKYPHRMSLLGSRFNNLNAIGNQVSASFSKILKIGNFPPEKADYALSYTALQVQDVFIGTGRSPAIYLESIKQQFATLSTTIHVSLNELNSSFDQTLLTPNTHPKVKVLLNGFALRPQGNDSGWHFGGLGIEIGEAKWQGNQIVFPLEVFTRPALSPEPISHGNKDRKTKIKWKTTDPCIYFIEVDYTVIIGKANDFTTENLKNSSLIKGTYNMYQKQPINHSHGNQLSVVGIQGFKFELAAHKKRARKTGRYIRSLSARVLNGTNGDEAELSFSNTILKNRQLTAKPWNMAASISTCALTFHRPFAFSRGVFTGQTGESINHTFNRFIAARLDPLNDRVT